MFAHNVCDRVFELNFSVQILVHGHMGRFVLRELPRGLAKNEGLDNRDTTSTMPRKFYRNAKLGLEGAGGRKRLVSLSLVKGVKDKIKVTECLFDKRLDRSASEDAHAQFRTVLSTYLSVTD